MADKQSMPGFHEPDFPKVEAKPVSKLQLPEALKPLDETGFIRHGEPVVVPSPARQAAASKVDLSQWIQNLRNIRDREAGVVALVRNQSERLHAALAKSKALGATDEQLLPVYAELDAATVQAEVIAKAVVENP